MFKSRYSPDSTVAAVHTGSHRFAQASHWMWLSLAWFLITAAGAAGAQENAITDVSFSSLPGNRALIELTFSGPAPQPQSFTIDNPARIALDFAQVGNQLKEKSQVIGVGAARSINTVEAKGRTRVVLNLVRMVPYKTRVEGNKILLTLDSPSATVGSVNAGSTRASAPRARSSAGAPGSRAVANVDFRRGKAGEGRVTVNLTSSDVVVDVREEAGKLVVEFMDTSLPENLEQRLDVIDFATPVQFIDTFKTDGNVRMEIVAKGNIDHMAYQSDNVFTLEVKEISESEQASADKEDFGYTGEKLSLNFQNIEVRAVLQLIADFTGLNLVASDTVTGEVTLRLKNVPWDQALDIVLKTKGLDMRQVGNVILVAPAEEIAAREKQDLEAKQQIEQLEPLRSDLVQINYAKAADIAALLKAKENTLMSERGSVTVDERTNTLLVLDTPSKLVDIRALVAKLDVPIRQVLIEARIVIANDDFSKELGVQFGATAVDVTSDGVVAFTGSAAGADTITSSANTNINATGNAAPVSLPLLNDRLNVTLPPTQSAGRFALGILGSDYLVDLELAAMQSEGKGEVVSSPKIITSNQKQALIEQGVEIPFQQAASSGATTVSFKKAVLSLEVTPQITPDDRIIMDLRVNKDSVGQVFNGVPSINTREINTQVLVDNGETVVLGGIYEQTQTEAIDKVPLLGDIPVLGRLFRRTTNIADRQELLIFITPKILKQGLSLR